MKNRNTVSKGIYATLIIFALSVSACNKNNNSNNNGNGGNSNGNCPTSGVQYTIDNQDLIDACYDVGTYWTYIDSVNNTTDSVYVHHANASSFLTSCSNIVPQYELGTTSSSSGEERFYYIVPGGLDQDTDFDYSTEGTIYAGYQSTGSNSIGTMFIYDQDYDRVMRGSYEDPNTGNELVYYINAEFGFLRIEEYANNVLISNKNLTGKEIIR